MVKVKYKTQYYQKTLVWGNFEEKERNPVFKESGQNLEDAEVR